MIRKIVFSILALSCLGLKAAVTLDECVEKAQAHYPEIVKYELLTASAEIDLSDINKGWLPRIGVCGQLTGQNIVPSFPESLSGVLEQMGQPMRGLGKVQYKIGADISQTIWDGGMSKARRELVRMQDDVRTSALDVDLYTVKQRVQNLYFAILLIDEQIAQQEVTRDLLMLNLEKLRSMLKNGVAMQSDVDMVEAQVLSVGQAITQAKSSSSGYRKTLGLFIDENLEGESLTKPEASLPENLESSRPELKLFDSQILANMVADRLSKTMLMPKIGFFAQAYYGYPGFNYFQSMMNRDMYFNVIAGVKVSWNIDSFYTHKNTKRKTKLNSEIIDADREVFLFNTRLQTATQMETIKGFREVMKADDRIIALRRNVRRAAESQLANGVIDATALLSKISDENIASLNAKLHEIQLIQEIYKLKYTLNR